MSIELLEQAAKALGHELLDEVVFVGAATLPLWITDPAAPPLRPTADVDVVVEVSTLIAYNKFEQRLRDAGFQDDGKVLGRFLYGELQLDAIPAEGSILGFEKPLAARVVGQGHESAPPCRSRGPGPRAREPAGDQA